MKKTSLLLVLFIFFLKFGIAQSYKYVYYLDDNLLSVDKANASLIGKGLKDSSLFLVDCFDKNSGKLSVSAHFPDSTLSHFEGLYKEYYSNGQKKEEGNYEKGGQQGEWFSWDSTGLKKLAVLFENGKQISVTEYLYNHGKLSGKSFKDSTGAETHFVTYDKKGNEFAEGHIFNKVEVPPVFQKGRITFQNYVLQSVNGNIPLLRGAPGGRYLVIINFVIETNGQLTNVNYESVEGYGMEAEAIRVVKESPFWEPALQNGRPVRFKMQVIVPFAVSR